MTIMCWVCNDKSADDDNPYAIHLGDGDFACSEECRKKYEADKAHFFDVIVHDEDKCRDYILGVD